MPIGAGVSRHDNPGSVGAFDRDGFDRPVTGNIADKNHHEEGLTIYCEFHASLLYAWNPAVSTKGVLFLSKKF